MNIKAQIISELENNRAEFVSGEEMAEKLNISRAAIWKNIKLLEKEGYKIKAIRNKGYTLEKNNDIISQAGILKYTKNKNLAFEVLKSIGSTNIYLRENVQGKQEGYIVVSGEQLAGKGRLGRSFFSPKDTGIYMSILLKPKMDAQKATMITAATAVAVCKALEQICSCKPQIKWVNDIFLNGKKLCGILSEASFNMENYQLDYVIVGIGINVYQPKEGFPEDIKDIATALFQETQIDVRNKLIALIADSFFNIYDDYEKMEFVKKYKEKSMLLGKNIFVHKESSEKEAIALDIDNQCRLLVKYLDNTQESLSSGEISVKLRS